MIEKNTYKRLGDYIREVNVRNRDLAVTELMGVSITKEFINSIANTIGTDMSTYKVVSQSQFAYGPVTSRNGDKVSIALYKDDANAIVSQAYTVFEVIDHSELMPEYLMMWFRRPEFDRYARFKSRGSAREIFDWDELCDTLLPVPDIEVQRQIVAEYETLSRRIAINEQICTKLEETAQALYRRMFVDNIDPEHLPDGWRWGILGEIAEITSGKSCPVKQDTNDSDFTYPVIGATGIIGYSNYYNQDCKLMTTGRVGTLGVVNRYKAKLWTSDNVLIAKTLYYEYCYQILRSNNYNDIVKGGVQSLITQTDLKNVDIIIPAEQILCDFERQSSLFFREIGNKFDENQTIKQIQTLFLSKLATN
ncbi:MAG: restriction endonuclease subunit S [Bacteroidales bacterium]|nr:restriction endonuclease subunit S [Bacteroidales bacterium]